MEDSWKSGFDPDLRPSAQRKEDRLVYNRHKVRKHALKKLGLTSLDEARMMVEQGFSCAICSRPFSKMPNIDHDHKTGKVRGLLCGRCNSMLGFAKDRVKTLKAAIRYLIKSRKT